MTIQLDQRQSQRLSPPPRLRRANSSSPPPNISCQHENDDAEDGRIACFKRVDGDSPLVVVIVPTGNDEDITFLDDEDKRTHNSYSRNITGPLKKRRKRTTNHSRVLSHPSIVSDDEGEESTHKKKDKTVRFCSPLVTKIVTRPYTHPEDIPKLFYSASDEARFRAAVYEERESRTPAVSKSVVSKAIVVHQGTVLTYLDDDNAFLDDPMFWNGTVTW
eukprot:CAMPEP_0197832258 /NCGR_PEP_ID=MMETSP1437-20131217/13944_1 /TAXON_ID=49252 ORGANISM="Eucampia antarctica, Strain CCMP1452" /NCGR_SAMPLE_ID=MMETSP1437 /ASSEMBLY_ACC=CAM_ASM_001096 /LENGTH=217 /DNA_ID=CAMNT_0043435537 /DNA_START=39 /DNA_END=689 /DNA_ORIENTATION=+